MYKIQKRIIVTSFVFLLALCLFVSSAFATTYYEYDSFKYYIDRQNAEDVVVINSYLDENTVIDVPENILGDKVTTIDIAAFSNLTNVTSVSLPKTLTRIYSSAFKGMSSLESLVIPDNCILIGSSAFAECTSLNSVTINSKPEEIREFTFNSCTSLNNFTIPGSVKSIGNYAFANCTSLNTVIIPYSVTNISTNAFENDNKLVIKCYKDSYAEQYAKDNGISYEILDPLYGDANEDGEVNILDVTFIQKYKIGTKDFASAYGEKCADVNKSGDVTIRDATMIQMKIAKIIENF